MRSTTVTQTDSGRTVELELDDELIVELDETPATGFRWTLAQSADGVLTSRGSGYIAGQGPPGAGGMARWVFVASGAGRARIVLNCVRAWEKDPSPCSTFELDVDVSPRP